MYVLYNKYCEFEFLYVQYRLFAGTVPKTKEDSVKEMPSTLGDGTSSLRKMGSLNSLKVRYLRVKCIIAFVL